MQIYLHIKLVLKLENIPSVFKKLLKILKKTKRPVGNLPNVLKIYQRLLFNEINEYFECLFSKYQCSFPQGLSA